MNAAAILVDFAGSIALLLWGTYMVKTGIQHAFGPNLRSVLGRALRNRFRAFVAGMGVTAALQSSTATGLMIAGFAAGGLVDLVPALAVMLGANVGTTLIVQVLSFDVSAVGPALILVGVLVHSRLKLPVGPDLGGVFIGLGLMLVALHQLLGVMSSFEDSPTLQLLLGAIGAQPVLDVLLAAVLTWAAHSSVAVVLLVMSLAAKGVVPPEAALALVLGANLGTAINPLIEGPKGTDPAAKRLPLGNLLTRIAGVVLALALLPWLTQGVLALDGDRARAAANFHTLFNLALALLMFPLLSPFAELLKRMLPRRLDPRDPSVPMYLDVAAHATPAIAIGGAAREALRLVDVLAEMLAGARETIARGNRQIVLDARRRDDVLDSLNGEIKAYLTSLPAESLTEGDLQRLNDILVFATNLEQAGDVLDRNLLPHIAKRIERGLAFSKEGQAELTEMMDRLIVNLRTAASLFMTEDGRLARLLADEKLGFREAEARATASHFERLRSGRLDAAQTSAMHLDLLRDMKAINSHMVAAAAYPVLKRTGELLPSRLAAGN